MLQEESNKLVPIEQRTTAKTILVVEDDEDIREFLALLISTATAYHYHLVADASQAIQVAKEVKPDLRQFCFIASPCLVFWRVF